MGLWSGCVGYVATVKPGERDTVAGRYPKRERKAAKTGVHMSPSAGVCNRLHSLKPIAKGTLAGAGESVACNRLQQFVNCLQQFWLRVKARNSL
jgi:hypothetical protein